MKPIVLIGPMGVGKTTIGKKLAKALSCDFIDTDKEITRLHGSISKIFELHGEPHFRLLETSALRECLNSAGVVATGGGVITTPENLGLLKRGLVVYLSTDGRHIGARLVAGKRPLIKNGVADWKRIYEERKPLYEKASDIEVATSSKPLGKIVQEIMEAVANV